MAKAYRALRDVSFPKPVAQISENDWATEGKNYSAGQVITEDSLTPKVRAKAEAGELDHVLIPLDDEEAEDASYEQSGEPQFGVFVAEHEAEAHALRMGGHFVVPKDQALEALASGSSHAASYQKAAEEAGVTRRPHQEAMAAAESEEGRLPNHLLHGMETRSGLPHNRGLSRQQLEEGPDEEDGEDYSELASEESEPAARPKPGGQTTVEKQPLHLELPGQE